VFPELRSSAATFMIGRLFAPVGEMKSNPVAWFEIYVQDPDRAKRFYESVFQVTLKKLNAPFAGVEP
jgi:hypothetical protein